MQQKQQQQQKLQYGKIDDCLTNSDGRSPAAYGIELHSNLVATKEIEAEEIEAEEKEDSAATEAVEEVKLRSGIVYAAHKSIVS